MTSQEAPSLQDFLKEYRFYITLGLIILAFLKPEYSTSINLLLIGLIPLMM